MSAVPIRRNEQTPDKSLAHSVGGCFVLPMDSSVSLRLLYHTRNKNAICSKIAVNALYGVFCVSKGIYPLFSLSLLCGLATACKRQENSFSFTANLSINRVFHIGF